MQTLLQFHQARPRRARNLRCDLPARVADVVGDCMALVCLIAALGGGLALIQLLLAAVPV